MREVLGDLRGWWQAGDDVALATVVSTFRSAPRPAGAAMLVGPDRSVVGSVSGGCVEGDVYERALAAMTSGAPSLTRYGVSDDDALSVGLTCGGVLDVFVEVVSRTGYPEFGDVVEDVEAGRPVAVTTVVAHPCPDRVGRRMIVRPDGTAGHNGLGSARIDTAVRNDALGMLAAGSSGVLSYGPDGQRRGSGMQVFVAAFAPRPRMLVFGAIDFAAAVARLGSFVGYDVTVCDARPVFATARRFPDADRVVVDWPHRYLRTEIEAGRVDRRTVVAVLTHDPKFDVPLLEVALRTPEIAYVGAMGSRRTHDERMARLREAHLDEMELARLRSPIGLDLGARTPEETAVSIVAEMIAGRWGGTGASLSMTSGRIHIGEAAAAPAAHAVQRERERV
ncbi:XdhC family protein [Streptomyces spongiae]|uniref:XdhC family protein n=1 Tax=Streptomyces spongiae TaxID=565072 RepID=A0A5N8X8I1_9ACTN|nr:XdhC/CoxI family protein [Streptomyces spongiae]MPY55722.1 XdhC family protein [Streptomyces spongiae]